MWYTLLLCINYVLIDVTTSSGGEEMHFESSPYYIFSLSSRKSVDCSQSSSRVQQYSFHGGDNQQFKMSYDGRLDSGLVYGDGSTHWLYQYFIRCKDDNDYWTLGNGILYDDDIDHEANCDIAKNCKWMFSYIGDNKYQIFNLRDEQTLEQYVLDVPGGSSADSKQLQAYHNTYSPPASNQVFFVIPKPEYKCPFTVLSVDHSSGTVGKYFNFDKDTVSNILGTSLGNSVIYKIYNYRTFEIRTVRLWNIANGGSVGDAHGRIEPISDAMSGDWQTGDVLAFVGKSVSCSSSSVTVECPFAVLDTHHANGFIGVYFRFNRDTVEDILGGILPSTSYFNVRNLRDNAVKSVIVWNNNNGGSIGSGHGRIEPIQSSYNYWRVGDVLMFEGKNTVCLQSYVNEQ